MKRFFTNKYPVNYGQDKEGKILQFEVGTCFTISGISGSMFELEPISKVSWLDYPVLIDAKMLEMAFNEQDHLVT